MPLPLPRRQLLLRLPNETDRNRASCAPTHKVGGILALLLLLGSCCAPGDKRIPDGYGPPCDYRDAGNLNPSKVGK